MNRPGRGPNWAPADDVSLGDEHAAVHQGSRKARFIRLALALDALWRRVDRWRWLAPLTLLASAGMFAHFYPIISAAKLSEGKQSFAYWMWLPSWR